MQNNDEIFDPKRYELFTLDNGGDLNGLDEHYWDGGELIMLVSDVMQAAQTVADEDAEPPYTMEDYPVTVDEAIEFLEVTLGIDVHQFEIEDYARLDADGLVH